VEIGLNPSKRREINVVCGVFGGLHHLSKDADEAFGCHDQLRNHKGTFSAFLSKTKVNTLSTLHWFGHRMGPGSHSTQQSQSNLTSMKPSFRFALDSFSEFFKMGR
jgi:hypothetical protein